MARVYGESGRYVTEEAVKKRRKIVTRAMITMAVVAVLAGVCIAHALRINTLPFWPCNLLTLALALLMAAIGKWSLSKLDALEWDRVHMSKGPPEKSLSPSFSRSFLKNFASSTTSLPRSVILIM